MGRTRFSVTTASVAAKPEITGYQVGQTVAVTGHFSGLDVVEKGADNFKLKTGARIPFTSWCARIQLDGTETSDRATGMIQTGNKTIARQDMYAVIDIEGVITAVDDETITVNEQRYPKACLFAQYSF